MRGEVYENGLLKGKKAKNKDVQFRFSDTQPPERDKNGKTKGGAKNGRVTRRDRRADESSFNIHRCMYTDRGTCICVCIYTCMWIAQGNSERANRRSTTADTRNNETTHTHKCAARCLTTKYDRGVQQCRVSKTKKSTGTDNTRRRQQTKTDTRRRPRLLTKRNPKNNNNSEQQSPPPQHSSCAHHSLRCRGASRSEPVVRSKNGGEPHSSDRTPF